MVVLDDGLKREVLKRLDCYVANFLVRGEFRRVERIKRLKEHIEKTW